jgi:hypothetical protein
MFAWIWPLQIPPVTSELCGVNNLCEGGMYSNSLDSPNGCAFGWGSPSHFQTQKRISLHVKCSLLWSGFNQNWNVLIHFGTIPQYQISRKFIQLFSSCCMQTDRTKLNGTFLQLFITNVLKYWNIHLLNPKKVSLLIPFVFPFVHHTKYVVFFNIYRLILVLD